MSKRFDAFVDTIENFLIGFWNNAGISGQLILILLSPIAFAIVITFWVFKLGFKLLILLIDEVNYYWRLWAIATQSIIELLNEFLKKKIYNTLVFLWKRLYSSDYVLKIEENHLSKKWFVNLLIGFLSQFFLFIGVLIIITTSSSLIYTTSMELSGREVDLFLVWILRFLLLTPLIHRYIRFKISKVPFSWEPATKSSWFKASFYASWIFVIITLAVIAILIFLSIQM